MVKSVPITMEGMEEDFLVELEGRNLVVPNTMVGEVGEVQMEELVEHLPT
jgi:hypothetical protein